MVTMHDIYVSDGELTFCFDNVPTAVRGVAAFTMRHDTGPAPKPEVHGATKAETFGSVHLDIQGNNEVLQRLRHGDEFTLMGLFRKRSARDTSAWIVQGTIASVNLVKEKFTFDFINGVSARYATSELNLSQCPPR